MPGGASFTRAPTPSGHFGGHRDDVVLARNHQERGARERRVGVLADDAAQRLAAVAALDDRGDDALADAGRPAALVDDEDPRAFARVAGDRRRVQRLQPAQVDDAYLPAVRGLDAARRLIGTPLPNVKTTRSVASGK